MAAHESSLVSLVEASPGRRWLSDIVDVLTWALLHLSFVALLRTFSWAPDLKVVSSSSVLLGILYYVACERYWGRTLGKIVVGARVVSLDGAGLSLAQAGIRCGARFVPFEGVSLLGGRPWRDRWSRSLVVSSEPSEAEVAGYSGTELPGLRPIVAPFLNLFLPGTGHMVLRKYWQGSILLAGWVLLMFTPWAEPVTMWRLFAASAIMIQVVAHRAGWWLQFSS